MRQSRRGKDRNVCASFAQVDVKFIRDLKRILPLRELRTYADYELSGMSLLGKGRLSVQPVSKGTWSTAVCKRIEHVFHHCPVVLWMLKGFFQKKTKFLTIV